jgi:hypothetical protein
MANIFQLANVAREIKEPQNFKRLIKDIRLGLNTQLLRTLQQKMLWLKLERLLCVHAKQANAVE